MQTRMQTTFTGLIFSVAQAAFRAALALCILFRQYWSETLVFRGRLSQGHHGADHTFLFHDVILRRPRVRRKPASMPSTGGIESTTPTR